jgi:hypothetical protein
VDPRGAPSGSSAAGGGPHADATLTLNGNDPAQWPLNQIWNDNLGALFTHSGQSETIYSTTTVDATISGNNTLDYWALIPSSGGYLHATRAVVVQGASNDNPPPPVDASTTPQPRTTTRRSLPFPAQEQRRLPPRIKAAQQTQGIDTELPKRQVRHPLSDSPYVQATSGSCFMSRHFRRRLILGQRMDQIFRSHMYDPEAILFQLR